ncbi:acetyl esterase [Rhizobium sp. BK529]|uniref:alpha/beta hydrolase n=1 Tax=unclassified Rhizobium TaxID=2613769 RepID=UPI00104F4E0D|nr:MULTISPECIES: alpha/beta hydrolase [unclassified Rhizobium]MBB3593462.1 acetyl esterase [Rhizobium sp. BK529]TCS03254.1 acetyl esterase [Rhizobium sp. BK418]
MSIARPIPTEEGIREFLKICESFYPPDAVDASISQQRQWYDRLCARFDHPLPQGLTYADGMVSRIPIRRYRPRTITTSTVLLYLHGGGFVAGSLESHHSICAEIADFAGAELISVDYRLAPEHRWPSQSEDCFIVLQHLLSSPRSKVVVVGDSAGANLAAGLAVRSLREALPGLVGQVLIYPTLGGDLEKGSYVDMANAPGLTTADVAYYRTVLRAPSGHPVAEPLHADSLAGLAPAFITVARFDPLRDDGRSYAGRLAEAGVEVWFREEPQMVHAWLRARYMSEGARAGFVAICEAVRLFASR